MEKQICCICKKEFTGYGNNPWPVWPTGKCCDWCNQVYVIPARIKRAYKDKEK